MQKKKTKISVDPLTSAFEAISSESVITYASPVPTSRIHVTLFTQIFCLIGFEKKNELLTMIHQFSSREQENKIQQRSI